MKDIQNLSVKVDEVIQESPVMDIQDLPLIMTAEDVAKALGISKQGAYELFKEKGFPVKKVGRLKRVNRDSFIEWTKKTS